MGLSSLSGLSGLSAVFGGGFVPSQISGLVADWNPGALSLNDGDAISSLTDTYGGYHATATSTLRPTFKTNILGTNPAARFAGAQGMVTPNIDLSATGAITLYVVGNPSTSGSDQILVERTTNFNSFPDGFLLYRTATNQYAGGHVGNVAGALAWTTADGTTPRKLTTTPRVLTMVLDKGQAAASEIRVYRGSTLFGAATGASNNTTLSYGAARPLYFGARAQASVFLTGDLFRILLFNTAHTQAQRWLIETYLGRLYNLEPIHGTIIFDGDSLTYGTDGASGRQTTPYPSALTAGLSSRYAWDNFGVPAQTLVQMEADAATQIDANLNRNAFCALVVWGGLNDMATANGSQSGATTFGRLQTYCNSRRAAGWTLANNAPIYVITAPPSNSVGVDGTFETRRNAYNTLIRAGDSSYDRVIDLASDSRLDDGTGTVNATIDAGDHVHLTNTGYGYVAALVKTALGVT